MPESLQVALVVGGLAQGGAEKQLVYLARALQQAGVCLQVYSLTRHEYYEQTLSEMGIPPVWIGRYTNPLARIACLVNVLRKHRPHVLQSTHTFTNFHVAIAARIL